MPKIAWPILLSSTRKWRGVLFFAAAILATAIFIFSPDQSEKISGESTLQFFESTPLSSKPEAIVATTVQNTNEEPPPVSSHVEEAPVKSQSSEFQKFTDWFSRYQQSNLPDRTTLIAEGVELAQVRRTALKSLIQTDPEAALAHAFSEDLRQKLPAEITELLEENVNGTGRYEVNCVVALKGEPHSENETARTATIDGQHYLAHVYGEALSLFTMENVPMQGVAVDSDLAISENINSYRGHNKAFGDASLGSSDVTNRPVAAWTHGNKKVLVIRVDFPDLPGEPIYLYNNSIVITTNYAAGIFNNTNGVRDFYRQNSYGKTDLLISEADISPVYRMPTNAVWYAKGDSNRFFGAEMQEVAYAAAAADYDLSQYDRIGLVHSYLGSVATNSLMKFAGQANINGKYFFINGAYDFAVLTHEFGHTYGINHANWWKPSNNTSIGTEDDQLVSFQTGAIFGISQEYGDIYDGVGANASSNIDTRYHFNHWLKNTLHWIPDSSVTTVTNSGIYRVYRFDDPGVNLTNNKFALKICRDRIRDFWIGYRHQFTNMNNGTYVLFGYNFNRSSELIDCNTPGTNLFDAAINVGQSFTDTNAAVTITTLAKGGVAPHEYLDLQITLGPRVSFVTDYYQAETTTGSISATVERAGPPIGVSSVNYACVDITATNGVHYLASSGTLTWLNGDSTTRTITFPTIPYPTTNGHKAFRVVLSNPINAGLINPLRATNSIRPPGNAILGFKSEVDGVYENLIVLPDGKILVGGSFVGGFARLHPDGRRDSSFITTPGANNGLEAMARQPDGKILIGGGFSSVHGVPRGKLARLNEDGSLDTNFVPASIAGNIKDIAIQPDGKIIVVGEFRTVDGQACLMTCRLHPNGALDFRFPSGYSSSFHVAAIALDNHSSASPGDVRILVGGQISKGFTNGIVRLKSDGTVDLTFQLEGVGANNAVRSLAIQPDGKILVGGDFSGWNGNTNYGSLVRLHPNGALDTSFDVNLLYRSWTNVYPGSPHIILLQPDGKILIGGLFDLADGQTNRNMVRLTSTGAVDPTWDNGTGYENGCNGWIFSMAMRHDGTVLAGSTGSGWPIRGGSGPLQPLYTGLTNRAGIGQFALANYTVRPGRSINLAVTRVNGSDGNVKADFSTQSGTAMAGTNFPSLAGTLVWTNGDSATKSIVISASSNAVVGSTFKVNLGIPQGGIFLGAMQQALVTVSTNYSYEIWRAENFDGAQQVDDNISGVLATPANDGVKNLLKYTFDLAPFTSVATNLPSAYLAGDRLRLVFTRDPIKSDLTYEVQASTDLESWMALARSSAGTSTTNINAYSVSEATTNSFFEVTVDDSATVPATTVRFIRLKLSK